jgi:hypothetical protein
LTNHLNFIKISVLVKLLIKDGGFNLVKNDTPLKITQPQIMFPFIEEVRHRLHLAIKNQIQEEILKLSVQLDALIGEVMINKPF